MDICTYICVREFIPIRVNDGQNIPIKHVHQWRDIGIFAVLSHKLKYTQLQSN